MALEFAGDWPDDAEQDQVAEALRLLDVKPEHWRVYRLVGSTRRYLLVAPELRTIKIFGDTPGELKLGAELLYRHGPPGLRALLQVRPAGLVKTA